MWVTKLLISPVRIRIFSPKTTKSGPKLVFLFILGQALPAHLVPFWLVGWLVGGCGARAVSRKTPIYSILCIFFHLQISRCISGWMTLYMPMAQYITAKVIATTGLTKCAKIVACRSLRSVFAPCSSAFLENSLRLTEY